MTPERWRQVCVLFAAALRCPAADRAVLLGEACAADPDLRAEVERLLADDADAGRDGFLEVPTVTVAPERRPVEGAGFRIGPYKLLQKLGEGGMGVVYLAEQEAPVRRRVAVKIIKPGMDTDQVIAHFAAERQALALRDHPHVARVLDAGATDSGRPYFVMGLVRGIPITRYCDENKLTPRRARAPGRGRVTRRRRTGPVEAGPGPGRAGPVPARGPASGRQPGRDGPEVGFPSSR
jgi:eukaryotic-like serine/threonine-protein kinase